MKKYILNESIDRIIEENINNYKKNKLDAIVESVINQHITQLNEDSKSSGKKKINKKRAVIQWLRKPEIDKAEIRRQLEGEPENQAEEDSKRSYFMKKINQKYGKDFTDEEVNRLYSIKTNLGQ